MNPIVDQVPTSLAAAEQELRNHYRHGLLVAILLAVWLSTRPFYVIPEGGLPPGGDIVNQLTFSLLAIAATFGAVMADPRALRPLVQPSYICMVVWLFVSVSFAMDVSASFRALAFSLIVLFLAGAVYSLPRDFERFRLLLFVAAAVTVGLSYLGIVALPDRAVHTDFDPYEPQHAGSWKGHFDHKNVAGPMMGSIAIMGLYAMRTRKGLLGAALLIAAVAFLYFTRSKTALGLLPAAVLLAWIAEKTPWLVIRLAVCIGPILVLLVLTAGSALFPGIAALNKAVMSDPSFTGRFDIWRYGFEMWVQRPLFGYGFEAFWQTPITLKGESKLELDWAAETIVSGHNSYMDVLLTLGVPGLVLVLYIFVLKPVLDFHRCQPQRDNQLFAAACLAIWLYIALGMCLESYIFRRADPVWFTFLLAVFGLRFTSAFRIDRSPSQAAQSS